MDKKLGILILFVDVAIIDLAKDQYLGQVSLNFLPLMVMVMEPFRVSLDL